MKWVKNFVGPTIVIALVTAFALASMPAGASLSNKTNVTNAANVVTATPLPACTVRKHQALQPGQIVRLNIHGPAIMEIWVNYLNPAFKGLFWNPGKQPPWNQTVIKTMLDWGQHAILNGPGGDFTEFAWTQSCQDQLRSRFNQVSRTAKTPDELLQWGIIHQWDDNAGRH